MASILPSPPKNPRQWIVKVFDHRPYGFEISCVRRSNRLGRRSYGYPSEDKRIIAKTEDYLEEWVFHELKALAKRYANHLNQKEGIT